MKLKIISIIMLSLLLGGMVMAAIPEGAEEELRKEYGYPPKIEMWHFRVAKTNQPNVYEFTMIEVAQYYLGDKIFFSLPERFTNIKGIETVQQEDRELYYIQSNLNPSQLKSALWEAFLSASAESFGK